MKLRTVIATAATAAVLASSGVAIAGAATGPDTKAALEAQSASATPSAKPAVARRFRVHRRIRRLLRGAGGVVTQTIGIDRKTLREGLRSGKTVAQIATDHNVSPQTVIDALVAAANKKIDAAVQAGKLDPDRAARIEQRLPARITKLVNNWHPKRFRGHAAA
jgi:hypothetical protein